jgi:hypothetical protein
MGGSGEEEVKEERHHEGRHHEERHHEEEEEESKHERYRRAVEEEEMHVQHGEFGHGLSEGKDESGFSGLKKESHQPIIGHHLRQPIFHLEKENVFFEKAVEYFKKSPRTERERQCFEKNLKPGFSVDFVIDVAPSPSSDEIDKLCAESPIGLFLERSYRSPSKAYFSAIQMFIDTVTLDMKPEFTHSIIYENGRKFYLRGRGVDQCEAIEKLTSKGDFMDVSRNLKTLWPVCTKEVVSKLESIIKNNLGRMTKLALWNRDNGLATVLSSSRRSKPGLVFVITDGSSGAKITDLTDDLSRTIVFDIGNHRFIDRLSWDEVKLIVGTYTLTAPQQLSLMMDTARNMACRVLEQNVRESVTM